MRRSAQHHSGIKLLLAVWVLVGFLFSGDDPAIAAPRQQKAPNFSYPDLNRNKVDLASYRGKVILLNFWATWCGPCLIELPRFAEWQQQDGGQNLQIIGISMDDEAQPVRAAYRKYRLNYPVVMGDEKLGENYGGILGLPVTFLIDRNGNIRFKHQGETDLDQLHKEIQTLVQEH